MGLVMEQRLEGGSDGESALKLQPTLGVWLVEIMNRRPRRPAPSPEDVLNNMPESKRKAVLDYWARMRGVAAAASKPRL